MTEEALFAAEVLNERNKRNVRCQYCNSLILKANNGDYVEHSFHLPLAHQKQNIKDMANIETESLHHYWLVGDMFIFENIGFSHTVEQTKYLICADCEMGPVGYHNIVDKKCYIALKRVRHGESGAPNSAGDGLAAAK